MRRPGGTGEEDGPPGRMQEFSRLQPADKGGLVPGLEPRVFVEMQCGLVLAPCEEHNLVAARLPGQRRGLSKQRRGPAAAPEVRVGDHILNKGVGPGIPGQVWNDEQDAGGYDAPLLQTQKNMVIWVG